MHERLREIIFEADTPAGKAFDVGLLLCIIFSVLAVLLDSVAEYHLRYGAIFRAVEWAFTILFTLEYLLRLVTIGRPLRYAFSFFGLVDLLAILPTYLSLFIAGTHSLAVIRALRLLRIFRILKLVPFLIEAEVLRAALWASARKIVVFLGVMSILVLILGSLMYLIEGEESGFTSIPKSIYWAIVTLTTVGYGDIAPKTVFGQVIASVAMITGYAMIAVPTGIVTAQLAGLRRTTTTTRVCGECATEGHDIDAKYCKCCGAGL